MPLPEILPSEQFEMLYNIAVSDQEVMRYYYHDESKAMVIQSSGFLYGEELRNYLMSAIKTFEERKLKKLVGDHTYRKSYTDEDREWIEQKVIPMFVKAGLSHYANIVPQDIFMQFTTKKIYEKKQLPFDMQYFKNLEEAINWLKED